MSLLSFLTPVPLLCTDCEELGTADLNLSSFGMLAMSCLISGQASCAGFFMCAVWEAVGLWNLYTVCHTAHTLQATSD